MPSMGYTNFHDIKCVYCETKDSIQIIPVNKEDNIVQYLTESNFLFSYKTDYKNKTAFIERILMNFDSYSLRLIPKYIFEYREDVPLSSMEITGEAIDDFFNPASYYFPKKRNGEILGDLLYSKDYVASWNVRFENQPIKVSLSYGNILSNGIGSDLMLHPKLRISFNNTNDVQYLYKVYLIIQRFLQFVRYDLDFGHNTVELIDSKDKFSGKFYDFNIHTRSYVKHQFGLNFNKYQPYIEKLLQFSADSLSTSFSYFPQSALGLRSEEYTSERFVSIFGAFENEYKLSQKLYGEADTTRIKNAKDDIIEYISSLKDKFKSKDEKSFLDTAKSQIGKIGVEVGQAKKIEIVYSALLSAMKSSIDNIFYRFNKEKLTKIRNGKIKDVAKDLTSLRGKCSHTNSELNIREKTEQEVRFFEILVYSQMLKRARLDDIAISKIIGIVFGCNFEFQNDKNQCF